VSYSGATFVGERGSIGSSAMVVSATTTTMMHRQWRETVMITVRGLQLVVRVDDIKPSRMMAPDGVT
jgi:hypothetical protein